MEDLLYYVWQQRVFTKLKYATDRELEIIDPGLRNFDSGPDFFNAKLKWDGTVWAGNVEMHVRASDWYAHHHDTDPAYSTVILHVVMVDDAHVTLPSGEVLTQVILPVPDTLMYKYRQLTSTGVNCFSALTCASRLSTVPSMIISDWKTALAAERMAQKMQRVRDLVERDRQSWHEAFYILLCRAYGTGVNGDACERLARSLPYVYLQKHMSNPLQVESLLLGQAGFLDEERPDGPSRYLELQREYRFLKAKFRLQTLPVTAWRMGRIRPEASPVLRMSMLAQWLTTHPDFFSEILAAETLDELFALLVVPNRDASGAQLRPFALGRETIHSLIINAVTPFLTAYAQWSSDEGLEQRAMSLLDQLPAEHNRYVGFCAHAGLRCTSAFDSQALLQLYRNYCERHQCLRCRIGYWLMRH